MAISSVFGRYLGIPSAMDGSWEETKHHRADNGQFTSGSGRGKAKEDKDDKAANSKKGSEGGREEMSEEKASRIVRRAFEEAKCELAGLKLVNHSLNASVKEADEGTLDAINEHLTKNGLKAKISDKTTFKIAEDGYDDIRVLDDPMLGVLVLLCCIEMVAKDLHYRAEGKAFYGLHLLADLVKEIGDASDDLNEVYYMGEKGENPPDRAFVAGKAAELVGQAGDENALITSLADKVNDLIGQVEVAKKVGIASGTAAVLDEISKKALQAKGLLARTMKSAEEAKHNDEAINTVIDKGIVLQ